MTDPRTPHPDRPPAEGTDADPAGTTASPGAAGDLPVTPSAAPTAAPDVTGAAPAGTPGPADPPPPAGEPTATAAPAGTAPPVADARDDRHTVLATAIFGGVLLLAAVLVVVDALNLPDTGAVVGPAAVPLPVGALTGVVGIGLLVSAVRALPTAPAGPPWQRSAGLRVVVLAVALAAFAVLLPLLGWVVSAAALFVTAALLLGAPRDWRVPAYGWALAAVVFLVFDRLIGLTLPAGPWGF